MLTFSVTMLSQQIYLCVTFIALWQEWMQVAFGKLILLSTPTLKNHFSLSLKLQTFSMTSLYQIDFFTFNASHYQNGHKLSLNNSFCWQLKKPVFLVTNIADIFCNYELTNFFLYVKNFFPCHWDFQHFLRLRCIKLISLH